MPTNSTVPPIYYRHKIPSTHADRNTLFVISYKLTNSWQIIDTNTGCTYTPQAFEAYFGHLPPCPPSATRRTRKLWTAHKRQQSQGFDSKQNPAPDGRGVKSG